MKRLFLVGILGACLCVLQLSAGAEEKKAPVVTRDNFVSVEFSENERMFGPSASGRESQYNVLRLDNHQISWEVSTSPPGYGFGGGLASGFAPSVRQAPLSYNQLDALIRTINKNKL